MTRLTTGWATPEDDDEEDAANEKLKKDGHRDDTGNR
jgi:hypothetical protein